MLQVGIGKQLSKVRRQAKKRGLRVVRDRCGGFTVISTQIEPPRPLLGLDHAPLWAVEQAIFTPLPEPPPRRARRTEPVTTAQAATPAETTEAPTKAPRSPCHR